MKKRMVRTDLYLTAKQHRQLRKSSEVQDLTMSELLRRAIDEYLERRLKR
tara:strand:- start:161 stop:310 length:150 start_codon:yes stop_codon:yes gene_type:complete